MIDNKEQPNRVGLTIAVIGLSITTMVVLVVGFFFVSSLMLWRQPVLASSLPMAQESEAQTAVSQIDIPAVELQVTPTLTVQPTRLMVASEEVGVGKIEVEETAVSPATIPPPPQIAANSAEVIQFGELIIPSLNVAQLVTTVPLENGQWDISNLNADIGHLTSTGTHPGDELAMTFTGHVTVPWSGTGPFADLILLEHGQEIIYRWNGVDYIYQVERIFRAHPSNVDLLYESDGDRINLVTCSGWDFVDREYAERLVTRAVLIREESSHVKLEQ